jgi:hypothetical protein
MVRGDEQRCARHVTRPYSTKCPAMLSIVNKQVIASDPGSGKGGA